MDAKPLLIVLIFALILAVIASGMIGNVDLTDSGLTQSPASASPNDANFAAFSGAAAPAAAPAAGGVVGQPVTGGAGGKSTSPYNSPCGSSYTVQSGDTLLKIARTCLISVEDLLATNPSITNPNVISAGQKITIYNSALPIVTSIPAAQVTPLPTLVKPVSSGPTFITNIASGMKPGTSFRFEVQGFAAYAEIEVWVGQVGKDPTMVKTILSDQNGAVLTSVSVPMSAKEGETWTVTVNNTVSPRVQAVSAPFVIGK